MRSNHLEVRKHGLEKTLEGKALEKIELEMGTPEWKANIARRVLIQNRKQKLADGVGSIPMFQRLQEIRRAKCQNPQVQIPLNPSLDFGISLPAFVTLHIVEHTLPMGQPRYFVHALKGVAGVPFCVISTGVEGVANPILKLMKQPPTNRNLQATMGVPSEITFSDVLRET